MVDVMEVRTHENSQKMVEVQKLGVGKGSNSCGFQFCQDVSFFPEDHNVNKYSDLFIVINNSDKWRHQA